MNGSVNYVTIIVSDNGLSPIIHLIVLWTNTGLLSIKQLGTKFNNVESKCKPNFSKRSIWIYQLSNCNDFVQAAVTKLVFPIAIPHLPLVPHICVSDQGQHWFSNGLSPIRCQAITWNSAELLSSIPLGTKFSEIWIRILKFSFRKLRLKMSVAK